MSLSSIPFPCLSLPPSLSLSLLPSLPSLHPPRGLGALRRARRSEVRGPPWPPVTRTALSRHPALYSGCPSEGRSPIPAAGIPHNFLTGERQRHDGAAEAPVLDLPFVFLCIDARRSPEQPYGPER